MRLISEIEMNLVGGGTFSPSDSFDASNGAESGSGHTAFGDNGGYDPSGANSAFFTNSSYSFTPTLDDISRFKNGKVVDMGNGFSYLDTGTVCTMGWANYQGTFASGQINSINFTGTPASLALSALVLVWEAAERAFK